MRLERSVWGLRHVLRMDLSALVMTQILAVREKTHRERVSGLRNSEVQLVIYYVKESVSHLRDVQ